MRHLHSLELLLQQKLPTVSSKPEPPAQASPRTHTYASVRKTVSWFNSHTCHTQHPEHPLGRSTRGREIMCKALAPQPGDPVPAPRLLWAVMPQAPCLPQQFWCSPSHSLALVKIWEYEEAAEKCYHCKKLFRFLSELFIHPPSHASDSQMQTQHRPAHLDVQGTLSPGPPGAASPPEHQGIPQSVALQTRLLHGKPAKSCNHWGLAWPSEG